MKIDLNTKTTYGDDDKYLKTKIKTYKDSIITNFCNKNGSKKIPEEKVPQVFLEDCKYVKENIKPKNYIDMELESESDSDSDIYIEE